MVNLIRTATCGANNNNNNNNKDGEGDAAATAAEWMRDVESHVTSAHRYLHSATTHGGDRGGLEAAAESALKHLREAVCCLLERVPPMVEHRADFELRWRPGVPPHEREGRAAEALADVFADCSECCCALPHPLAAVQYARFARWTRDGPRAQYAHAAALRKARRTGEAQEVLRAALPAVARGAPQWLDRFQSLRSELAALDRHYRSARVAARCAKGLLGPRWPLGASYVGPMEAYDDAVKGRGFRAGRAIAAGETLLIEKGIVSTRCGDDAHFWQELLLRLDAREDLLSLYMDLFPTARVPAAEFMEESVRAPFAAAMEDQYRRFSRAYPRVYDRLTPQQTREWVWKKYLNAYELFDGSIGLYPVLSLFNHSCDANTVRFLLPDGMALLVAARDIDAGAEVSVHYCPLSDPRCCRQRRLLDALGFRCACARCAGSGGWGGGREADVTALACPGCGAEAAMDAVEGTDELTGEATLALHYRCRGACAWALELPGPDALLAAVLDTFDALKAADCDVARAALLEKARAYERMVPRAGRLRIAVLCGFCKHFATAHDGAQYAAYLQQVKDCAAAFPDPQMCAAVANMLMVAAVRGERDLTREELGIFALFGIPLEVVRRLWDPEDPVAFQRYFYCVG